MARVYCSFCYKTCLDKQSIDIVDFCDEFDPNPALERFLILLQTYLGESFMTSMAFESLRSCSDCVFVMESFCTMFLEMKCFESQLGLKLQQLQSVMTIADIARSSHQPINNIILHSSEEGQANENRVDDIASFRRELQRKCTAKLLTSFPNPVAIQQSPYLASEWTSFGMGWILSFIVVSILGTNLLFQPPKSPSRLKSVETQHPLVSEDNKEVHHIANQMEETIKSSAFLDSANSATLNPKWGHIPRKKHATSCRRLYLINNPSKKLGRSLLQSEKEIEFDRQFIKSTVINFSHDYTCAICGFFSYHKPFIRKHVEEGHRIQIQETPLKCYYCGKMFAKTSQLQQHLKLLHVNEKGMLTRGSKEEIKTRQSKAKAMTAIATQNLFIEMKNPEDNRGYK
ncbi:unnamed protein product [Orchesella dallaii]|uniref:C2H2-type domain-containing protein n=1 Tax=Orchesella dallaii TaxID=48710 RepID=A0ABP1QV14_9HEXA